jgi:cell division control protein 24
MHYKDDIFILAVPAKECKFSQVVEKIERKLRIGGHELPQDRQLKIKYEDADKDIIMLNSDEDLEICFDSAKEEKNAIHLYVE